VNHRNKWLRNVFRHYVQYLYHRRRIPLETFGWIMEVVPSRSYRLDVKVYRIDLELFGKTMEFLKQRHELYYLTISLNITRIGAVRRENMEFFRYRALFKAKGASCGDFRF